MRKIPRALFEKFEAEKITRPEYVKLFGEERDTGKTPIGFGFVKDGDGLNCRYLNDLVFEIIILRDAIKLQREAAGRAEKRIRALEAQNTELSAATQEISKQLEEADKTRFEHERRIADLERAARASDSWERRISDLEWELRQVKK